MSRIFNCLLAGFLAVSFVVLPSVAAADGSASDVLFAAHQKLMDSRWVTELVSTDKKGRETHSTFEFEAANRFRVTSEDTGFVILPEGIWMRSGKSDWMQPPIDMSAMVKGMLPMAMKDVRSGTSNVKDLGMRNIDGKELRAISYDVNTKVMGFSSSSHNTVFIDGSGRIVRSESDSTAMKQKSHAVQTIRYDDSIRISAPK